MQRIVRIATMFALTLSLAAIASAQHEDHKDKHDSHPQDQPQMRQQQPPPANPNQGFFGARFGPIDDEIAENLGLDSHDGVVIMEVMKDSPAEKAGIKENDVVRKLDDKDISDAQGFSAIMRATKPDQQLKVSLIRDKKAEEITVTLGKRPASMDAPPPRKEKEPTTKPSDK